jgi:hypothetical protein
MATGFQLLIGVFQTKRPNKHLKRTKICSISNLDNNEVSYPNNSVINYFLEL